MNHEVKPSAPLVGWVGDDFTGSAAVMEALTFAGLPAMLFLDAPDAARLQLAEGMAGIGIATMARTRSPDWMDAHLPDLFSRVRATGAELVQYKVCTTLDSAPHVGSIGRAMEIGLRTFGGVTVPIVIAAPVMRRYQAFGNLFAAGPGGVSRLDRHPVMSRHPVTPMDEADVARHIARQTDLPLQVMDVEALADPGSAAERMRDAGGPRGWCLDQMGPAEEAAAGRLIWEGRRQNPFVVGSQGIEYALIRHWRQTGRIGPAPAPARLNRAERMAVVSGSVSPVTAAQIDAAEADGFAVLRLDAMAVAEGAERAAVDAAVAAASAALGRGAIPLVCTARGPDDPEVARLTARLAGKDGAEANARIGRALGAVLARLVAAHDLRRVVVSGGDTSGEVCTALGIHALTALAPTIPDAAICRAHADGAVDGLEIALKGGQMGSDDYFAWVRDGGGAR
ncbi:four-carbon acid sugar kinase family protein [Wenxinia saemankumensis]|uniref:Uncharacterized conserved protein YgbK, DUF1537 family n=1 Tax=Wenxinia saemankumensis TaxID=1447782 RepID=A0A1M5ZY36_9RHOB|nr:four-carbon acid sugar kinase family protein [Wenxinia saemankumensis]SHI29161.1 Uncharacterized conserved protein YgbK, DUF1537 family [Wenxinia saemankumensis]